MILLEKDTCNNNDREKNKATSLRIDANSTLLYHSLKIEDIADVSSNKLLDLVDEVKYNALLN